LKLKIINMSDILKEIENLKLHEETVVQEDELTLTVAMRVPGGLIYKFCEVKDTVHFTMVATEFVPFDKFKDTQTEKEILKS